MVGKDGNGRGKEEKAWERRTGRKGEGRKVGVGNSVRLCRGATPV